MYLDPGFNKSTHCWLSPTLARIQDHGRAAGSRRTLVTDLKDRPEHLVPFLAFMWSIFGVFHLIAEF